MYYFLKIESKLLPFDFCKFILPFIQIPLYTPALCFWSDSHQTCIIHDRLLQLAGQVAAGSVSVTWIPLNE